MAVNTTSLAAGEVYKQIQNETKNLRSLCVARKAKMAAGTFNADDLIALRADCLGLAENIQAAAGVPGIVDYAKTIEDDPAYDVAAEYAALRTLCLQLETLVNTLIAANLTDANGYVLLYKIVQGQSNLDPRVFAAGQTATLQTKTQEIIDSIIV